MHGAATRDPRFPAVDAEELKELSKLAKAAANMPVMALSVRDGLEGRDFAATARERMMKRCHEIALAHGLPEIPGYYGITSDGEFVAT